MLFGNLSIALLMGFVAYSHGARLPYIIGGQDVDYPGKWPWQGSLRGWLGGHKCGCVLASADWVITAAHCISSGSLSVILGAHDIKTQKEGQPTEYQVSKKIRHEGFIESPSEGYPNDIGLLRLAVPADISSTYISPVELARPEDGDFSGWKQTCFITGWGDDGGWFLPNTLQEAQVLALKEEFCQEIFGTRIGAGHICVAYNNERGACSGDSGGPLVCDVEGTWRLVGVTSWGKATCNTKYPSVYTRISHFRAWLGENTDDQI